MSIIIHGPDWPTVQSLRESLRNVPESGSFTVGGNKLNATQQLERFRINGIHTVESTRTRITAEDWLRQGHIVFARRELHSHGSDIVIATPGPRRPSKIWTRRDWWCKFIPSVGEWRIHVFNGSSIARGHKTYNPKAVRSSSTRTNRRRPLPIKPPVVAIRSRRNGWMMEHTTQPSPRIREAARAAVSACGYLYGAVDILELSDGSVVVLEVNLLPAMDDYTRRKYVEAIRAYVRGERTARDAKPLKKRTSPLTIDPPSIPQTTRAETRGSVRYAEGWQV